MSRKAPITSASRLRGMCQALRVSGADLLSAPQSRLKSRIEIRATSKFQRTVMEKIQLKFAERCRRQTATPHVGSLSSCMASSPCMQSLPDTKVGTFYPGAIQRGKKTVASLFCMGQAWKIATIRVANLTHPRKIASSAQNIGADCLCQGAMHMFK